MYYFFAAIFGLIIGSFLNCLIWRLYTNESLWGRSYCPRCHHQIAWYDNIPVFSYFFLKAKCRYCHKHISWQYPLVEAATALLFTLAFYLHSLDPNLAISLSYNWILISFFIVIFIYDLRWQLIPINFVWLMLPIIFIFNIFLGVVWWQILLWGIIGGLFFLIQYLITNKKGIGEGDIWLGLLLGLSFPSVYYLLLILLVSYTIGSIVGVLLMLFNNKYHLKSRIALAPFLVIGGLTALLYGSQIIFWYLSF